MRFFIVKTIWRGQLPWNSFMDLGDQCWGDETFYMITYLNLVWEKKVIQSKEQKTSKFIHEQINAETQIGSHGGFE